MIVLKGTHPVEGEIYQEYTTGERDTAVAIGQVWQQRGWKPRLLLKSWDGRFNWLTLQSGQKQAA